VINPDKKCPRCGLWNSGNALVCDCGFDFKSGQVTLSPLALSISAKPEIRDRIQKQIGTEANIYFLIACIQLLVFFSIRFPASLFTVFTAAAYLVSGLLARRRRSWGFYFGTITCIVEMLLCLALKNYWGAAMHFIALGWIWRSIQALRLSSMLSQSRNPKFMREAVNAASTMSLYRTPGLAFRIAFWMWIAGVAAIIFLYLWFAFPR
jgi:hypothetical protein